MNIKTIKAISELIDRHEAELKATQKPYAPDWNQAQISIQILKFKEGLLDIIAGKDK